MPQFAKFDVLNFLSRTENVGPLDSSLSPPRNHTLGTHLMSFAQPLYLFQQLLARANNSLYSLHTFKTHVARSNALTMGKKKGKLALAAQQQARESQGSDSKLNGQQPFVGQALLDALEAPKQDATTPAGEARKSDPPTPAAGPLPTKASAALHSRPLNPLPPKSGPTPTAIQPQSNAAGEKQKQPPWRASHQNYGSEAQANQYTQYPQSSYPQAPYPQASYPQNYAYGTGYHIPQLQQYPPISQWPSNYPTAPAVQYPQINPWQQSSYGPAPGGGVCLYPKPLEDMLEQWKLSDSPPDGNKLHNSTALRSTPNHSTSSGWTSINKPAMINESAVNRPSPSPRASPRPRGSPAPPGGKRQSSPKIHLPAPQPTEAYLNQAAKTPELLSRPQRPLLVLDLNGTLVHRPGRETRNAISRPFLAPFLKYIFENFSVMVWSSAKPHNVSLMVNTVLTSEQRSLLVAEWARDKFGLSQTQYTQNVQVYKELSKIWAEAETLEMHPQHERGQRWGQHNTILLDDSDLKASSEPFNLIQIPEFVASEEQMQSDVLREVAGYLDEVRMQNDVSAFMKRTPFKANGQWNMEWPDEMVEGVAITA